MTFWRIPQKLADKPPLRGSGEYPMIFCFRCEAPTVVMVRQDTSHISEWYEEKNGREQIYVVLKSDITSLDGSRMRLNLCGDCAAAFGPDEFDMVMPFIVSGLKKSGGDRPHVAHLCGEYECCRPVKVESFDEAHRNVNKMLKENEERSKKAILDEALKDREMSVAMAQIQGKVRKNG